ncbi:hypothetical protein MKK75_06485 [Methylobacterium sp. J-030]|uniref:hypothetical protein n=1 Tax=Methylobacterium sp. J-030 TaxID=2836627 RepID=UPI001FB9A6DB|nr:hypothetical protein [Methylobacterium sp. J-030]MCJ2068457.1 hypothetical protein [Methylobacterium sp. J-030]
MLTSHFQNKSSLAPKDWDFADGVILTAGAVIVAIISYLFIPAMPDDAYIYLRIAANIGSGQGWLYNVGELTNPATSPIYTIVLTVVGLVFGYSSAALAVSYGIPLYALVVAQYVAWRRDGRVEAIVITAGTAFGARLLQSFGMETSLLMALVSFTALAYQHNGDSFRTGVFAGLTALTRPEGIILMGLIGACHLMLRRQIAWRSALVTVAFLLSWVVISWLYFGTVVPHTAEVKSLQRRMSPWINEPDFFHAFILQSRWLIFTIPLVAIGLWLTVRRLFRNDTFPALCVGFGLVQVLGYQLMDAPGAYFWYFEPGDFATNLAIMMALVWFGALVRRRLSLPQTAYVGAMFLMIPFVKEMSFDPIKRFPPNEYRHSGEYKAVAAWLRANSQPADAFAATEIGYLGWYSKQPVLDINGLVHRRSLPGLRQRNLHWWWDEGERPRYVVVHRPPWDGEPGHTGTWPAQISAEFASQYHKVFEYEGMEVFERNSAS